jgi:hypothetical protein
MRSADQALQSSCVVGAEEFPARGLDFEEAMGRYSDPMPVVSRDIEWRFEMRFIPWWVLSSRRRPRRSEFGDIEHAHRFPRRLDAEDERKRRRRSLKVGHMNRMRPGIECDVGGFDESRVDAVQIDELLVIDFEL